MAVKWIDTAYTGKFESFHSNLFIFGFDSNSIINQRTFNFQTVSIQKSASSDLLIEFTAEQQKIRRQEQNQNKLHRENKSINSWICTL